MRRRRILLTGGLIAIAVKGTYNAIKLSQQDAQRIETHTGQKPEDLSEEQLEAAIDELDIETHDLTDADVAAIEAADAEPVAPPLRPHLPHPPHPRHQAPHPRHRITSQNSRNWPSLRTWASSPTRSLRPRKSNYSAYNSPDLTGLGRSING